MVLNGKKALVTGASRGIGRAIALALAQAGADVVINFAQQAQAAEEVAAKIQNLGRRAYLYRANVADFGEAAAMVQFAQKQLGGVDILVNNAGV
ncbi:MAG: SDR family NAD(P)-dependent oxidoreductase, partial [Moorella sp. (in: Bacteria)]|nr:SDR family NAD(P)-dependent oxidoreductase [Moorella sp. (in: firmicutes)]